MKEVTSLTQLNNISRLSKANNGSLKKRRKEEKWGIDDKEHEIPHTLDTRKETTSSCGR